MVTQIHNKFSEGKPTKTPQYDAKVVELKMELNRTTETMATRHTVLTRMLATLLIGQLNRMTLVRKKRVSLVHKPPIRMSVHRTPKIRTIKDRSLRSILRLMPRKVVKLLRQTKTVP